MAVGPLNEAWLEEIKKEKTKLFWELDDTAYVAYIKCPKCQKCSLSDWISRLGRFIREQSTEYNLLAEFIKICDELSGSIPSSRILP
jgi:hypothetical protein